MSTAAVQGKLADIFRIRGQYLYDESLQLGEYCRPESVDRFRHLELDESDVIIASYPKTGTTFLQECVWLIRNNADIDLANQTFTYNRTPFVEDTTRDNISVFHSLSKPRSLKTHLPYRLLPIQALEKSVKVIYIYRNPRDTLVSFYHFYRSTKQFSNFPGTWDDYWDMFYRVNKGLLYYGNIFDHIRGYWEHRNDENLLIVAYEHMLRHHQENLEKIAKFLNVKMNDQQISAIAEATRFDSMKENPKTNMANVPEEINPAISEFMRKGEIGDWINYFSKEQLNQLEEMRQQKVGDMNVEFIYQ